LQAAREKAQEFAQKAKRCLETFPDTPYKDALRSLPDFMLDREF
jgi:geranylgeranyl pyrophosphate synthase